jgi:hypothetical protein
LEKRLSLSTKSKVAWITRIQKIVKKGVERSKTKLNKGNHCINEFFKAKIGDNTKVKKRTNKKCVAIKKYRKNNEEKLRKENYKPP